MHEATIKAAQALHDVAARVWEYRLAREPYFQAQLGVAITRIPVDSHEAVEMDASFARRALEDLRAVDRTSLSHTDLLTHEFLADRLGEQTRWSALWWSQFPVTPYALIGPGIHLKLVFQALEFSGAEDAQRYVSLMRDYAMCIASLRAKLQLQAERGWYVPRPALPVVTRALRELKTAAVQSLHIAPARSQALGETRALQLNAAVRRMIETEISPAFDELLASLGTHYAERAPATVGMSQYPGGEAAYRAQVLRHVTYEVDPESVHALGAEEVRRLSEEMNEVRSSLGFRGLDHEFRAHLRDSGRLHASTVAEVEQRYRFHIERMAAAVPRLFEVTPAASYDVMRLDASMEAGLSYGYYEQPTPSNPIGCYRYNGSGLNTRSQLSAAAIIFHELVPGHHFHLARQAENVALPSIRRYALDISAFNEGWAEYASSLAREVDLYDDPYDWYGRLAHERFTAQRLVVDTGLNLLGWSLERAHAYMKEQTFESDEQVASETLRYATDLPGQALAYRLGYLKLRELRSRAQCSLRERFDVRRFHEAVLGPGALPLAVLDRHIAWFITQH